MSQVTVDRPLQIHPQLFQDWFIKAVIFANGVEDFLGDATHFAGNDLRGVARHHADEKEIQHQYRCHKNSGIKQSLSNNAQHSHWDSCLVLGIFALQFKKMK